MNRTNAMLDIPKKYGSSQEVGWENPHNKIVEDENGIIGLHEDKISFHGVPMNIKNEHLGTNFSQYGPIEMVSPTTNKMFVAR